MHSNVLTYSYVNDRCNLGAPSPVSSMPAKGLLLLVLLLEPAEGVSSFNY